MDCVIFDIDGTLSDPTHRLHYLTGPKKSLHQFLSRMEDDPVIPHIAEILRSVLKKNDCIVLFLTARDKSYRTITLRWLWDKFPELQTSSYGLLMRKQNDIRSDVVVKEEWLVKIIDTMGYDVRVAFEDRDSVIEMYKKYDIFTIKVGDVEDFDPYKLIGDENDTIGLWYKKGSKYE